MERINRSIDIDRELYQEAQKIIKANPVKYPAMSQVLRTVIHDALSKIVKEDKKHEKNT